MEFLGYMVVFHKGCTNLYSYYSVWRFPFLHILANICVLFDDTHVTGVVIFPDSFDLHFPEDEHLFLCLLTISMSSLEKCLFKSSAHFLIELFVFLLLLSCMSYSYILDINLLSVISFGNTFSISIDCLFICWWFPSLCKSFKFN